MGSTVEQSQTASESVPIDVVTATLLEDKSSLILRQSIGAKGYTLARMSGAKRETISRHLERYLPVIVAPSIIALGDAAWEIVVLRSYLPTFRMPSRGFKIDFDYDPFHPTEFDIERWGYITARELCGCCFVRQALWTKRRGWCSMTTCYAHFLSLHSLDNATIEAKFLEVEDSIANPSWRGFVQTETEAIHLIEAYIRGYRPYSVRGSKGKDITMSSKTFVWEPTTAQIATWTDGIKWVSHRQDGYETCVSTDRSTLIKKTFKIKACGVTHYVVSYAAQGEYLGFSTLTSQAKCIQGSIRPRLPLDLLQYILNLKNAAHIPVSEQEPAEVNDQTIMEGPVQMRICFPRVHSDHTNICAMFSGGESHKSPACPTLTRTGIGKEGIDRDRSLCLNMAKGLSINPASHKYSNRIDTGFIYICINLVSAPSMDSRKTIADAFDAYQSVRQLCKQLKKPWNTDPNRIILSGSSL